MKKEARDREAEVEAYIERRTRGGRQLTEAKLSEWKTPASEYPKSEHGSARIMRYRYQGTYMSFGVRGNDFVTFEKRVGITALQIDRKTWMVDDPWHMWSIEDIAKKLSGRVLVGGLGLGLIIHELAKNENVTEVIVIERNTDVIALVGPHVAGKCTIVEEDFFDYIHTTKLKFDSAFIDLWVTGGFEDTRNTFYREVIPLAFHLKRTLGVDMYALGFTGTKSILEEVMGPEDEEEGQ